MAKRDTTYDTVPDRAWSAAQKHLVAFLLLAALMMAGAYYYAFNPSEITLVPRCLFHQLTGLACPGCGMQRFLHALLHGRIVEAISYNYLLLFLLPYACLFAIERLLLTGKVQQRWRSILEGRAMTALCCVMAPAWFIIRNILGI